MKTKVMLMNNDQYRRKLTSQELLSLNHPSNNVIIAGTLSGQLLPQEVQNAIQEIQKKYMLLRVKIEKINQQFYFVEEKDMIIPFITGEFTDADNWIEFINSSVKKSLNFQNTPLIRIIFLKSQNMNQVKLILLAKHTICDGKSLYYLFRDLLLCIEGEKIGFLRHPPEMNEDIIPGNVSLNLIEKYVLKKMNKGWEDQLISFDQQDYECIFEGFWKKLKYEINILEFSQTDTLKIINYCKENHLSVNSFLNILILKAYLEIFGNEDDYYGKINIPVDLRDYTNPKIGEHLGFYARGIDILYRYNLKQSFIKNAQAIHEKIQKNLTLKNLFKPVLLVNNLSHRLIEALLVKELGKYAAESHPRYKKLINFANQKDMVKKFVEKKELDKVSMNFIITNIGKLDLKINYSTFNLESINLVPPSSFISKYNIGVATVNNKLILNFSNYEHITSSESTISMIEKLKSIIKNLNIS